MRRKIGINDGAYYAVKNWKAILFNRSFVAQHGQHTVTLETGMMARQATAAVMVLRMTPPYSLPLSARKLPCRDLFPPTVNHQERTYAAGRIPGSFFSREGRPRRRNPDRASDDRPVRPLFPEGFVNEVQVIATAVSVNPQVNPDIVTIGRTPLRRPRPAFRSTAQSARRA